MKKHLLEEFIRRYDVGMLDQVVWICKDNLVEVAHKTDNANAAIRVTGKFNLGFTGRLCIPDTGLLKKILSILSDDIQVELLRRSDHDETPHRLMLSDDSTTIGISLGSEDAFPKPTAVKATVAAPMGMAKLSPMDVAKISRTVAIWKNESFSMGTTDSKIYIHIGKVNLLQNTVSFVIPDSSVPEKFDAMQFSTESMSKILSTHKQNDSGTLVIYPTRTCVVKFTDDLFESTYTFFETKKK